jgi:hypothetical protein
MRVLWLGLVACGGQAGEQVAAQTAASAILAKADAHDGKVDQVVSECAMCGLGMAGDPANDHQHEGYELHFCSSDCRDNFAADPGKAIGNLARAVK